MKKTILLLSFLLFIVFTLQAQRSTNQIDWDTFLSQHDLKWDSIPPDYYAGAIMGNGLLGLNIFAGNDGDYTWNIGHTDVTEGRKGFNNLYEKARLPIGYFSFKPKGKVVKERMRLSLWDAEASGEIETEKGSIRFRSFVDANKDVIKIETASTGEENNPDWFWNPQEAISPRVAFDKTIGRETPSDYMNIPNRDVIFSNKDGINYSIQELVSGMTYVTAWKVEQRAKTQEMFVTVAYENSTGEACIKAAQVLNDYIAGTEDNVKKHREWWHNYYPASFASFADAKMESFYWIQQYKLACMTRPDKLIIDLMGPWTAATPWPGIWWNLNAQLTYSPLFTANRLEMSKPVWTAFHKNIESLSNNVPVEEWRTDAIAISRSSSYDLVSPLMPQLADNNQYEVGNLTWMMYYYWQYCSYNADEEELVNRFYPLLKRCIAYYSHILYKGADGKYHLPKTASPEYKAAEDCNYDLALLRWGLNTLLYVNDTYKMNDNLQKHWKDVQTNLTDYPTDTEQGYMIGKDVKLTSSHRHYSHLLMIYPLYMINWEQPENRDLILRSLNHWQSLNKALQGYSHTGAASIYAGMGDGENAYRHLSILLNKYIKPNTLYRESGPVVETPFSAVTSLQELYLQSWNGMVRIFPALPEVWRDASFINFRTDGGFLLSAEIKDGIRQMVQIEATADGICLLHTGMQLDKQIIKAIGKNIIKAKYKIRDAKNGIIELTMKKGEIILIGNISESPVTISHAESECNSFGYKK